LGAVAFETPLGFEHRLRNVPRQRAAVGGPGIEEHEPAADREIEPWELHSELVVVCPELRKRALALLPERDPDAFLTPSQVPAPLPPDTIGELPEATSLPVAVIGYTLWRLVDTARSAFIAIGAAVALTLLAEIVH
jgi:hypothetical protein